MPRAVKLTEDNVDNIVDVAKGWNFDLGHARNEIEFNADYGWDTYLIMDGQSRLNNVVFTMFCHLDFFRLWKFVHGEVKDNFADIEHV